MIQKLAHIILILRISVTILGYEVAVSNADSTDFFYQGIKAYRDSQYYEAEKFFRISARQGDGDAQFLLGRMYYDGNSIKVNYVEALMWFSIAAKNGITVAERYKHGLSKKMSQADIAKSNKKIKTLILKYQN